VLHALIPRTNNFQRSYVRRPWRPHLRQPHRAPSAQVIGFDFAVREGFLRILADPPAGQPDRLADLLSASTAPRPPVLGWVLAAAWRAALVPVAEGSDPQPAYAALFALEFRLSS
jgi:hypothetical protein